MARGVVLRNPARESRLFRNRAIVAGAAAILLLLLLLGRMYYLQVIEHAHYTTLSDNNRLSIQPLTPTRGLIYDRNGVLLADNIPTYSLEIVPEAVDNLDQTIEAISKLITVTDADRERFARDLRRKRRFEAVPLRFRLTDQEVALLAVNRYRLPGVEVTATLTRHYPLSSLTAHTVGYVGRINEEELSRVDASNYSGTSRIGKIGIERSHEDLLHGKVGFAQVETNARGRVLRTIDRTPPVPGSDLYLTLDVRLQKVATEAFENERGALVAIDPRNGQVLAIVSVPSYDGNLFVDGIDPKTYRDLLDAPGRPLFNRALHGQYPPGSTVKPFIGLLGLESHVQTLHEKMLCPGWYKLANDDHRYRDWKRSGHGEVDLTKAITQSCDVFFYDLSFRLGIDRISKFMDEFGFGRPTGIDMDSESPGLMPSREWKRRVKHKPWFPGETLITGIGQGFMLTTPLQLASATATLSENGVGFVPHLLEDIVNPLTDKREPVAPVARPPVPVVNPTDWKDIRRAMINVVNSYMGTARRINHNLDYKIAGKTGTAQVFGIKQNEEYVEEDIPKKLRDHALFIGYAPADNPKIAVAVVVENGGGGGSMAAPIARKVMDAYLEPNK